MQEKVRVKGGPYEGYVGAVVSRQGRFVRVKGDPASVKKFGEEVSLHESQTEPLADSITGEVQPEAMEGPHVPVTPPEAAAALPSSRPSFLETPAPDEDVAVAVFLRKAHEDGLTISPASEKMLRVCLRIWAMLEGKNRAYGNSALDPVRCFSKADTVEQIRVRMDDKLSRLMRGQAAGEDPELDLMGYLVILKVAELPWPAEK